MNNIEQWGEGDVEELIIRLIWAGVFVAAIVVGVHFVLKWW